MIETIRVLADDLSGALDTAVCFAGCRDPLLVGRSRPGKGVFACSSGTRDLPASAAAAAFARSLPWMLTAARPFHKVDSRLRGYAAREIAAIHSAAPERPIVIAPALPAQGRIMRSGRVLSREAPGEAWNCEPTDIARELGSLGLDIEIQTPDRIDVPPGISLWDAETEDDLERIAAAAVARPGAIVCGSSGLAAALARVFGLPPPRPYRAFARPMLLIVGTAHPRTLRQIAELDAVAPDLHCETGMDGQSFEDVATALAAGTSRLITPRLSAGCTDLRISERIAVWLDQAAHRLASPGSLFVTGGETLDVITGALSAEGLIVTGQFDDGIPASRFLGGRWDGLDVVSKSGGFGPPDLISRLALGRF